MGKNGPQSHAPVAQNIAVQHLSAARSWGLALSPAYCLQSLPFSTLSLLKTLGTSQ